LNYNFTMKHMFSLAIFIVLSLSSNLSAQTPKSPPPSARHERSAWVDSVMATLTPDEKIAQLIMVAAWSNRGADHERELLKIIREHKIGGLIFFKEDLVEQPRQITPYQPAPNVQLPMAMDAEGGLARRAA